LRRRRSAGPMAWPAAGGERNPARRRASSFPSRGRSGQRSRPAPRNGARRLCRRRIRQPQSIARRCVHGRNTGSRAVTTVELPADDLRKEPAKSAASAAAPLTARWARVEALLDRLGDRLNPILVKEARQAMKSRQFVVTFSLLLLGGWLWTVLFIAAGVPAIYYAPVGTGVLRGYFLVLSVPLLIVVPYAAFRSLAGEWEDGTFELLSITALSARQIVTGKLASAALQMMV